MDEQEFLAQYDAKAFPPVAVAVDLVIFAIVGKQLVVFLTEREHQPQEGKYALPGSILQETEDLTACAARTFRQKVGPGRVSLQQFCAFSAPERDPRMRVVSIAYLALITAEAMTRVAPRGEGATEVGFVSAGENAHVLDNDGDLVNLAFDHAEIIAAGARQLLADLDRTAEAFGLLPDEFTLNDLQTVHEVIRGERLNKPAFRKRMLDSGRLEPLGRRTSGGAHRPAELYRLRVS